MAAYTRCSSLRCFNAAAVYPLEVPLCRAHAGLIDQVEKLPAVSHPLTSCTSLGCLNAATDYPVGVALCDRHRAELSAHLIVEHVKAKKREASPAAKSPETRPKVPAWQLVYDPAAEHLHSDGIVYYTTWPSRSDRLKIGTTADARKRFSSGDLRPFGERPRLLVVEPGGSYEETQRHWQFGHLRVAGEFFDYRSELVDHVAELRARFPHYRDLAGVGHDYD
ncbi:hypothetical protein [Streptomyces sp. NPDC002467]|uniref:hypothetical protein n=1 Tax=Streptomyces sp. NPDC002467 TaxID=3364647 RepID=UPI0036871186